MHRFRVNDKLGLSRAKLRTIELIIVDNKIGDV